MALHQNRRVRLILSWIAGAAFIGAALWLAADLFNEQRVNARLNAHVKAIITLLELDSTPAFRQRLDKIRKFINDNSVHEIDQQFRVNQRNPDSFSAGLL